MSRSLTCGIIGLGKMGQIRYQELLKHPSTTVTHGADPNSDLFRQYPGVKCSTNWRDVIASDVDAVFVATPNSVTPVAIVEALNAGKHVFSEKPPGRTVQDIEEIMRVERQNPQLRLKFGFNHRYHAGIMEAKRIIESGRLGQLLWMRADTASSTCGAAARRPRAAESCSTRGFTCSIYSDIFAAISSR